MRSMPMFNLVVKKKGGGEGGLITSSEKGLLERGRGGGALIEDLR